MSQSQPIVIEYFSDVLCIWAYGHQIRMDELRRNYADNIRICYRFMPLFASAHKRIEAAWAEEGGFAGFNRHCLEVAQQWQHLQLHPEVWLKAQPRSSIAPQLFLKAVQLLEDRGVISADPVANYGGHSLLEEVIKRIRSAFFAEAEDISARPVQLQIAEALDLPVVEIVRLMDDGEAMAALYDDYELQQEYKVAGSPTLVMNEGRQLLYGNLGYRVLSANVDELLHNPQHGEASWC